MNLPELRAQLQDLQRSWPAQWPGLIGVVTQSLHRLKMADSTASQSLNEATQSLKDCTLHVAAVIEADGAHKAQSGQEPSYHNRMHISQALVSLCALMLSQRQLTAMPVDSSYVHRELLTLLAMLAHDMFHTGLQNQTSGEIERLAIRELQPHLEAFGVSPQDQADIGHIILHTDPTRVPYVHQQCQDMPFDMTDPKFQSLFAVEADVVASALPELGPQLTQLLAQEWAPHYPQAAENLLQPHARLGFLKHMALFTSPASRQLGLPELVAWQLENQIS